MLNKRTGWHMPYANNKVVINKQETHTKFDLLAKTMSKTLVLSSTYDCKSVVCGQVKCGKGKQYISKI